MSMTMKNLSLLILLLFLSCHGLSAEEKAFEELDEILKAG